MTDHINSREITLDILMEILEKGAYSHVVLRQALNKYQYLDKSERAFISRITEGTLDTLLQLDYVLDLYSSVKIKKMKPLIRTLLRMSVYQILFMDRVPDSAVCDEAVKLAVKRRFGGLKGFVNGVLRNISRNKTEIIWPSVSIRYSMPEWLAELFEEAYGKERAEVIMDAFLRPSPMAVRVNEAKASAEEVLELLKKQGINGTLSPLLDSVLYLDSYDYLEGIVAFQRGFIQVQDVSSVLVGQLANPKEGDFILDVCGAPGGKALHMADLLRGTGMVEARDLSVRKAALIQENIDRSGFSNIRAKVWDALEADPSMEGQADVVLADLPCSGLGVIGRKPDIKYRISQEDLEDLAKLQRRILSVVQAYVKPGGTLVYSTCTINPGENEKNALWFLEHYPFDTVNLEERLSGRLKEDGMERGMLKLLPGIHPCDGFFISVFKRRQDGKL